MCTVQCLKTCPFEAKNKFDVIYEIHLTVTFDDRFEKSCHDEGIKIVHIDMGEEVPNHLMTSHTYKGSDYKEEVNRLVTLFKAHDFIIERVKVETTVSHESALTNALNSYYETHIAIDKNISPSLCKVLDVHKSRNLMKRGDSKVQMLTHRSYKSLCNHEENIKGIVAALNFNGIEPLKVITEYCLEDSNVRMDNLWFKK